VGYNSLGFFRFLQKGSRDKALEVVLELLDPLKVLGVVEVVVLPCEGIG